MRRGAALTLFCVVLFGGGIVSTRTLDQAWASPRPQTSTTIAVNTTADDNTVDGNCSLREAIQAADTDSAVDACAAGNGVDTIQMPDGHYTLTHGPLEVHSTVTILGEVGALVDGDAQCCTTARAFHVNAGADLTVTGLSIQRAAPAVRNDGTFTMNGGSLDNNLANWGNLTNDDRSDGLANFGTATLAGVSVRYTSGAIYNASGAQLFAYSVVFDHDDGSVNGGFPVTVDNGGAMTIVGGGFIRDLTCNCVAYGLLNGATMTISHVRFEDNAGIEVVGNFGGVIDISDSAFDKNTSLPVENAQPGATLTVNRSRFSANRVTHSRPGAILNEGADLYVSNSTVDHNIGDTSGGIVNRDTGISLNGHPDGGMVTLTNDTIADNIGLYDAGSGKHYGLPSGALTNAVGTAMIRNATVVANALVGGFHDWLFHAGGVVTMPKAYTALSNSILSDNTAPAPVQSQDCFGPIHSLGYNLVEDSTDCFVGATRRGNIIGVSAHLRALAANGGPTMTASPPWDSPSVDTANPATPAGSDATTCQQADQRGVTRPRDGNADGVSHCDIGALER